jgi:hypothetical protein
VLFYVLGAYLAGAMPVAIFYHRAFRETLPNCLIGGSSWPLWMFVFVYGGLLYATLFVIAGLVGPLISQGRATSAPA